MAQPEGDDVAVVGRWYLMSARVTSPESQEGWVKRRGSRRGSCSSVSRKRSRKGHDTSSMNRVAP